MQKKLSELHPEIKKILLFNFKKYNDKERMI